jgi:hypothetical protein
MHGHKLANEPVQLARTSSLISDWQPDSGRCPFQHTGESVHPSVLSSVFEQPRMGGRTPPSLAEPSIDDAITGESD